jgi:hypothetical protein
MSVEYLTLNSRLSIKKDVLTEKKLKVNAEEGFTRLMAFVVLVALVAFCIYRIAVDNNYFYIIQLILVLMWLAPHIKRVYTSLFIKTWKTSIRIDEIQSLTSSKLDNGLETQVTLHLKNGRKKFLIFRDAENQVDDFIRSMETNEMVPASLTR